MKTVSVVGLKNINCLFIRSIRRTMLAIKEHIHVRANTVGI